MKKTDYAVTIPVKYIHDTQTNQDDTHDYYYIMHIYTDDGNYYKCVVNIRRGDWSNST